MRHAYIPNLADLVHDVHQGSSADCLAHPRLKYPFLYGTAKPLTWRTFKISAVQAGVDLITSRTPRRYPYSSSFVVTILEDKVLR